jgi:hypothetical protein
MIVRRQGRAQAFYRGGEKVRANWRKIAIALLEQGELAAIPNRSSNLFLGSAKSGFA